MIMIMTRRTGIWRMRGGGDTTAFLKVNSFEKYTRDDSNGDLYRAE